MLLAMFSEMYVFVCAPPGKQDTVPDCSISEPHKVRVFQKLTILQQQCHQRKEDAQQIIVEIPARKHQRLQKMKLRF